VRLRGIELREKMEMNKFNKSLEVKEGNAPINR
jgi:hypothetical protein